MSKGLEALENIGFEPLWLNEDGSYQRVRDENKEDFETIKKELKELYDRREMMARLNEACEPHIIEDEVYKKARAFDIIKNKDVDIGWLKSAKDIMQYNNGMGINSYKALSQEEYDLLREAGL